MPLILNSTVERQDFRVFGKYFTLAPGQIKNFQDNIAHWLNTERRDQGLIQLPESLEDPAYASTDEGKALLEEHRARGIDGRVDALRKLIYNNQVSLRQDLEKANMKVDPSIFATPGEIAAMRELVKYQKSQADEQQAKVDEIKELKKQLG